MLIDRFLFSVLSSADKTVGLAGMLRHPAFLPRHFITFPFWFLCQLHKVGMCFSQKWQVAKEAVRKVMKSFFANDVDNN